MVGIIIDVVLIVMAIIIMIVWTKRGFAQSVYVWMRRIGSLVAAIILTLLLTDTISALIPLESTFAGWVAPLLSSLSAADIATYSAALYKIAVGAVFFLVVFLTIFYLVKLFAYLLRSLNKIGFFKLCDKTLGAIFSLVASYLVIFLLLTVVEITLSFVLTAYMANAMDIVGSSSILTIVHNTNFLGELIASKLGIVLPLL